VDLFEQSAGGFFNNYYLSSRSKVGNLSILKRRTMKELEITEQQSQSRTVLSVVGAVDSNTAPELQQALLRATETSTGGVELDLAKVSYLSSAGLRALLMAAKALQKRSERLKLINVPLPIKNVLNLTGFATFIDVSP
jgi:anti-sigma B factor antagonist